MNIFADLKNFYSTNLIVCARMPINSLHLRIQANKASTSLISNRQTHQYDLRTKFSTDLNC